MDFLFLKITLEVALSLIPLVMFGGCLFLSNAEVVVFRKYLSLVYVKLQ